MANSEIAYEIGSKALATLIAGKAEILLLDCRESWEHATARIEPSENMAMNTIPANINRLEALAEGKQVIVYCHHGVRSLDTVHWLRQQGFENAVSLAGGIDRWSMEVDPAVARY